MNLSRQNIDLAQNLWMRFVASSPPELIEQLSVYERVRGPEVVRIVQSLADIMGPLTVRERWELLGAYNLESLRRNVKLVGSSRDAARDVVEGALSRLYPTTAYAFKLIDDKAESSPFNPEMKSLIKTLIVDTPIGPK